MSAQHVLFLLFVTALVYAHGMDQQRPSRKLRKRDSLAASMLSFFDSFEKRLASLEAKSEDNTALEAKMEDETQKRLTALEAKMENETQQRLAALEAKMEDETQKRLKALEAKMKNQTQQRFAAFEAGMQRLEEMVSSLLTNRLNSTEHRLTQMEAKTNTSEERLATLEADKADSQSSAAVCRYQYQYQFEKEAPRSSGDDQRLAKLETELSRMQERVSALDQRLRDNDQSLGDLHNQSLLAMQGMVHTVTQLVAASEDTVTSAMKNASEFLQESAAALMDATTARMEQATGELTTRVSAVEERVLSRLDNATSLTLGKVNASESRVTAKVESSNLRHGEDVKRRIDALENATKGMCGPKKRTCQAYYDGGHTESGLFVLDLQDGLLPIEVFCDMTNGTGWAVFQRRKDGSENFYNNWAMYEEGFGDLRGEFWLGNRNLHRLTRAGLRQLRVDLGDWDGNTVYASYSHFSVGNASSSYTLSVSGYSGTARDSLGYNDGMKFSTKDRDNDESGGFHCAQRHKAAWWYNNCAYANPNSQYGSRGDRGDEFLSWYHWYYEYRALKYSAMKLK